MTREELLELGKKIVGRECTEAEQSQMMELFNANVPHPEGATLFFWPENYDSRTMDISKYDPTVEEVVDKCLSYRPVILPYNKKPGQS
jgi:hypothetical protein